MQKIHFTFKKKYKILIFFLILILVCLPVMHRNSVFAQSLFDQILNFVKEKTGFNPINQEENPSQFLYSKTTPRYTAFAGEKETGGGHKLRLQTNDNLLDFSFISADFTSHRESTPSSLSPDSENTSSGIFSKETEESIVDLTNELSNIQKETSEIATRSEEITKDLEIIKSSNPNLQSKAQLVDLETERIIKYENIIPNTDLLYSLTETGLKEEIIIKSPPAPSSFSYKLNPDYLEYFDAGNGVWIFQRNGQDIFRLAKPSLKDQTGNFTNEVNHLLEKNGDKVSLTLFLDPIWLKSNELTYPLTVTRTFDVLPSPIPSIPTQRQSMPVLIKEINSQDFYKNEETSALEKIDLSFLPSSKKDPLENDNFHKEISKNSFRSYFKPSVLRKNFLYLEKSSSLKNSPYSLSYSLENDAYLGQLSSENPEINNTTITYRNIYKDIDIQYSISKEQVLEEYLVQNRERAKDITRLTQSLKINHLSSQKNTDGSLSLYSVSNSKEIFHLPRPVMYEMGNKENKSYGLHFEITCLEKEYSADKCSHFKIVKVLDPEGIQWLQNPARNYPVAIDATTVDTTTSSTPTAYSFQRKTWHDGTYYWTAFHSLADTRIEFWYSADGASWTENTSARIAVSTSDFSIEADSSNAFIAYTNGYNIETRSATTYPGIGFSWGAATVVYNGSSSSNAYYYPSIYKDSSNKTWINSTYYESKTITNTVSVNGDNWGIWHNGAAWNWYNTHESGAGTGEAYLGAYTSPETSHVRYWNGYRFTISSAIPSGATISNSSIQLYGYTTYQWNTNDYLRFYISDYTSDAPQIASASGRPVGDSGSTQIYPSTLSSGVRWPASGGLTWSTSGYNTSTNVSSLVQYVLDQRGGLAQNSHIAIWTTEDAFPGSENYGSEVGLYFDEKDATNHTYSPKISITFSYYAFKAIQASNANDISAWGTASTLNTSSNSNQYGTIVSLGSNNMYAIWIDNATIYGKKYNGSAWDTSATTIATGITGTTKNMSAVVDPTNTYIHLVYTDSSNYLKYQKFTTSWQAAETLDGTATNEYGTISLNSSTNDLYAFWIRSNHIYYKKATYSTGPTWTWDTNATDWYSTDTNTYLSSAYQSAGNKIYLAWTNGSGSPYSVYWDSVSTASNNAPSAPSLLYINETGTGAQSSVDSPLLVGDTTPVFSAVYNDSDSGDIADKYQILVYSDVGCSSSVWDSGSSGTSQTNCTQGNRCADIDFGGTALPRDGRKYYWKIKYWDDSGDAGSFSDCTANFTMMGPDDRLRHGNYFFNKTTKKHYTW